MASLPINALIWLSVKPILKLSGPALGGYLLTRAELLPPAGSRALSQIILNVTLPALLFSKMVPSFNSTNIGALGPIVLCSLLYMGVSIIFGVMIRMFLPVPKNFRWGIISAAGWSNWGDLPTSVVQTVCLSAPFAGVADSNLAIAYVAIFILVFYITMFPLGGHYLISRDYSHPPKEVEDEETNSEDKVTTVWWRPKGNSFRMYPSYLIRRKNGPASGSPGKEASKKESSDEKDKDSINTTASPPTLTNTPQLDSHSRLRSQSQQPALSEFYPLDRIASNRSIGSASVRILAAAAVGPTFEDTSLRKKTMATRFFGSDRLRTIVGSRANSVYEADDILPPPTPDASRNSCQSTLAPRSTTTRLLHSIKSFVLSLLTPPTIALITALLCALVNNLKSLFVVVPNSTFNPTAPDNDPPLAIILDTASFIGAASVPLGLMVLGSAIARMKLPRPLSKLPYMSIIALAVAKLVILPIIGYFFVEALTNHTTLVDRDNKVLRFVLIYFSAVPTATTQVTLTQIYAPNDTDNNSDVLASYLIVQYIVFVVSSVILTAVTLRTIF